MLWYRPLTAYLLNTCKLPYIQLRVLSDWWVVPLTTKDEWRSTTVEYGALCVMMNGTSMMPLLCADSSITLEQWPH